MAMTSPQPIWTPTCPETTIINAFRHYVNRKYNLQLTTYRDMHRWSVDDIPAFAEAVFKFVGMTTSTPYQKIVDGLDVMYPPSRWFPGAKMNYAENMLQPGVALKPDGIAVTTLDEAHFVKSEDYTFRQLERRTAVWANALKRLGVGVGDRVAGKFFLSKSRVNSCFTFGVPTAKLPILRLSEAI
jgi:acetoacetyl-CoA synthetase